MKKLILALVLAVATVNSISVSHYQSTWYISRDDTVSPPKHFIGIKNFESDRERSYYFNEDIKKTDPYFRVRIDRDWTDADGSNLIEGDEKSEYVFNGEYNRFNKQFIHYLPEMDLADPRGGFYVLEDAGDDFHYLCEVRYFIQYFQTYQLAKLQYETLRRDYQNERKLILGGPDGIVDSNDRDYFTSKYINYWCSYHFGINLNEDNVYTNGERYRVLLYSSSDDYEFPVNPNIYSAHPACPQGINALNEEIYVPSEFYSHCSNVRTFYNWAGNQKKYSYCYNGKPDTFRERALFLGLETTGERPLYYSFDEYCITSEGKTFMKLNDIGRTNNLIITLYYTISSTKYTVTMSFQNLWNSNTSNYEVDSGFSFAASWNNESDGLTISAVANAITCEFLDSDTYGDNIDYIGLSENCQKNIEYTNGLDQSGSVSVTFTVKARLRLPFLNNYA